MGSGECNERSDGAGFTNPTLLSMVNSEKPQVVPAERSHATASMCNVVAERAALTVHV